LQILPKKIAPSIWNVCRTIFVVKKSFSIYPQLAPMCVNEVKINIILKHISQKKRLNPLFLIVLFFKLILYDKMSSKITKMSS